MLLVFVRSYGRRWSPGGAGEAGLGCQIEAHGVGVLEVLAHAPPHLTSEVAIFYESVSKARRDWIITRRSSFIHVLRRLFHFRRSRIQPLRLPIKSEAMGPEASRLENDVWVLGAERPPPTGGWLLLSYRLVGGCSSTAPFLRVDEGQGYANSRRIWLPFSTPLHTVTHLFSTSALSAPLRIETPREDKHLPVEFSHVVVRELGGLWLFALLLKYQFLALIGTPHLFARRVVRGLKILFSGGWQEFVNAFISSSINTMKMRQEKSRSGLRLRLRALKNEIGDGVKVQTRRAELISPTAPKAKFAALWQERLERLIATSARITFPTLRNGGSGILSQQSRPVISIILVLYNRAELTLACLESLANCPDVPFELVIVDNASSDSTKELTNAIRGDVRIYRNDTNVGFLKAANQAAAHCRGDYLLFLNNDAQVYPGTLSAALDAIQQEDRAGAVCGRIVQLDGTLQEAGSIVWRDGSCAGYGRGDDPNAAQYMFRRVVDYGSGAFLLTPRSVWDKIGGFDARFFPAYYEDTDYCMRLSEHGLFVVYEPDAVLTHFEFGSQEKHSEAISLQKRNRRIFCDKHEDALKLHGHVDLKNAIRFRNRCREAPKVLFIDDRIPETKNGAGFPRAKAILKHFVKAGCETTFYPMQFPNEKLPSLPDPILHKVEFILNSGKDGLVQFLSDRHDFYDTIFISRPHNLENFQDTLRGKPNLAGGAKIVYDAEAIFASREILRMKYAGTPVSDVEANELLAREFALAATADAVTVVSKLDEGRFLEKGISPVSVISHPVEASFGLADLANRTDFLFVGNLSEEGSPNVDSMHWFIKEVMPTLTEEIMARTRKAPRPLVVGNNRAPSLQEFERNTDVIFLGPVDDIASIYDRARVFVAPTRFAAGLPYKVFEAACRGIPVVATTLLATQMGWQDGVEISVADPSDPTAFAGRCVELYADDVRWCRQRTTALDSVSRQYSENAFANQIQNILS